MLYANKLFFVLLESIGCKALFEPCKASAAQHDTKHIIANYDRGISIRAMHDRIRTSYVCIDSLFLSHCSPLYPEQDLQSLSTYAPVGK